MIVPVQFMYESANKRKTKKPAVFEYMSVKIGAKFSKHVRGIVYSS